MLYHFDNGISHYDSAATKPAYPEATLCLNQYSKYLPY